MKSIDEFLEEELDSDNDIVELSKHDIRTLLMNWTAQIIINQEELED